ncbi:MAG: hypothetical protein NT027_14700 [Proteobacteria bacterium]|nr:hypothetical protein [Pseudomonadota bacterium]
MTNFTKMVIALLMFSQSGFAYDERQDGRPFTSIAIPVTNKTETPTFKVSDAHGLYMDSFDHVGFESTLAIIYDQKKPQGWYPRFGLGPTLGLSKTSRYLEAEFLTEVYHNAMDWVDIRFRFTYGIGTFQTFRGENGQQSTISFFSYYGIPLPAIYYRQRIEYAEGRMRSHEYGVMIKFSLIDDEVGY